MKLNVGVIFGGRSVEHDISILSAMQVLAAIDKDLYDVLPIYLTKDNRFLVGPGFDKVETFRTEDFSKALKIFFYRESKGLTFGYLPKLKPGKQVIDVIVPVVHGAGVEDGTLAGYLDILGVPYVGSKVTPSALAQDKVFTKHIYQANNINVLKGMELKKTDFDYQHFDLKGFNYPVIVKPATLGSSIGIKKAYNDQELTEGLKIAFMYDHKVLIEEALEKFREFNCAVLKTRKTYRTSAVEEVIPSADILSFSDKYETPSSKLNASSNRIIPATISQELTERIKKEALRAYIALDLQGVSRVDCLYDEQNDHLYVNEINTIPGSLSFYLMEKEGINFTEMINILIKDAFYEKNSKDQLIHHFNSSVLNSRSKKLNK